MAQKVLIVEDDGNIAELLHLYLEKEGFETKVAKDGGKGVEYFRSFQPDRGQGHRPGGGRRRLHRQTL